MKRLVAILLAMLLLCTPMTGALAVQANKGSITINPKHFPDKVFRNYVLKNIDKNKDKKLSLQEQNSVKQIDLYESGVKSLKGIEYFANLEKLECAYNALTELDVSKNKKLVKLSCNANAIKQLDVRKNVKLVELYCSGNALSTLDVRKNKKLDIIVCSGNKLNALDVSKNSELYYIECWDSGLKSITFGNNKKLLYLACSGNPLKKLSLKNCPKLRLAVKKGKRVEEDGALHYSYYDKHGDWESHLYVDKGVKLN